MNEVRVSMVSIGPVVDKTLADEFYSSMVNLPNAVISREVTEIEPPAAGFSEIANIIGFLADSKEVLLPIATALAGKYGGPAAGTFRTMLSRCRKNPETGRPYVPMMIAFGTNPYFPSVRFFFHREVDSNELGQQLNGMVEVLEQIPEEVFQSSRGPTENGFFWDQREARWRENYALRPLIPCDDQGPWFPEKVFDDWHG